MLEYLCVQVVVTLCTGVGNGALLLCEGCNSRFDILLHSYDELHSPIARSLGNMLLSNNIIVVIASDGYQLYFLPEILQESPC